MTPVGRSQRPATEEKTALSFAALQSFHARYWEAVREGMAFYGSLPRLKKAGPKSGRTKRRAGDNRLIRLHRFRFLTDFEVPFANNLAEQALRMMKVKMKNLRWFSNRARRSSLRRLALDRPTARKRRWNILQTLATAIIQALAT